MTIQSEPGTWVQDKGLRQLHTILWLSGWILFSLMIILSLVSFTLAAGPRAVNHWPGVSMAMASLIPVTSGIWWFVTVLDPSSRYGYLLSMLKVEAGENGKWGRRPSRRHMLIGYLALPMYILIVSVLANLFFGLNLQTTEKSGLDAALSGYAVNIGFFLFGLLSSRGIPRLLDLLPSFSEFRQQHVRHH